MGVENQSTSTHPHLFSTAALHTSNLTSEKNTSPQSENTAFIPGVRTHLTRTTIKIFLNFFNFLDII